MKFDFIYLDRVDSTNAYAQRLLKESLAGEGTIIRAGEGTVVRAADQASGRGQGENSWHSQAGMNLTFSLILEPLFIPPEKLFSLNKAVALAVLNTVRNALPGDLPASIKWPNDIYAADHKIAGILIEHTLIGSSVKNSIIGIGININQLEFPASLPNPVSLKQLTGNDYDIREMLDKVCRNLENEYSRLRNHEFQSIDADYNSKLYGSGRDLEFTTGGSSFTGRIQGVDDIGRLYVLTADGGLKMFNHGEIWINEKLLKKSL